MYDSFEENNNVEISNDIFIKDSSLLEKSIIFRTIENKLFEVNTEFLQEKLKYNKVLNQMKINYIHNKYIRKLYNNVLRQMLKDRQIINAYKIWNNLINSI